MRLAALVASCARCASEASSWPMRPVIDHCRPKERQAEQDERNDNIGRDQPAARRRRGNSHDGNRRHFQGRGGRFDVEAGDEGGAGFLLLIPESVEGLVDHRRGAVFIKSAALPFRRAACRPCTATPRIERTARPATSVAGRRSGVHGPRCRKA